MLRCPTTCTATVNSYSSCCQSFNLTARLFLCCELLTFVFIYCHYYQASQKFCDVKLYFFCREFETDLTPNTHISLLVIHYYHYYYYYYYTYSADILCVISSLYYI